MRRARVHIIATRGGAKLPHTVDSQVLFSFTRAHVVAALDNLDAARIGSVWTSALDLVAHGDHEGAKREILTEIPTDSGEQQYIRSWLTLALDRGLDARITPFGLSKQDIVEYLPVQRFISHARSWDELREKWQTERDASVKPKPWARDFKKWLATRFDADFSTEGLRRALVEVTPPKEFLLLMNTLEAISAEVAEQSRP